MVYDFVIFHAREIEDLLVKSLPPVQTVPIHNDPTYMQSHYSPMGPASTPRSGTISYLSSQAVQLGHPSSTFQGVLPLYNAGKNIESWGSASPVANYSVFGTPTHCQGFHAPMSELSHLPQATLIRAPSGLTIPHSLPQHAQFSTVNSLFPYGRLSLHEAASQLPPLVSSTSNLVPVSVQRPKINPLFATTPRIPQVISPQPPPTRCLPSIIATPLPATVAPTHASPSLFATQPSLYLLPNRTLVNSHPVSVSGLNISSMPPLGYINAQGASVPENNTSICSGPSNESSPSFPVQTIYQSMPSSSSFFSSIKGETSLPSATLCQVQHPSYYLLPSSLSVQTIHEDSKFKAQELEIESESGPLAYEWPPSTSMQEPLLSLPKHPSDFMLPSSLPVQTIHEDAKFEAQEPKIESESLPLIYERPPSATSMQQPLLPLTKHPSCSKLPSSVLVQTIHEDAKFKAQEPKIKSESQPLLYELPPLLPLPELAQRKFSEPVLRFTENFDFVAMNKKFNKAEVWGHLGKGKALAEYDKKEQSSQANAIRKEDEKPLKLDTQPAYRKADFFDKFSHKRKPGPVSGRDMVSEQLRLEKEISGDFSRRRSNEKGGSGDHSHGSSYDRGNSSNTKGSRP